MIMSASMSTKDLAQLRHELTLSLRREKVYLRLLNATGARIERRLQSQLKKAISRGS